MITLKNKKQLMVIVLALFMAFAIVGTLFTVKKNVAHHYFWQNVVMTLIYFNTMQTQNARVFLQ